MDSGASRWLRYCCSGEEITSAVVFQNVRTVETLYGRILGVEPASIDKLKAALREAKRQARLLEKKRRRL